jgi:type II secretory pathway predicted ATPase ExeA
MFLDFYELKEQPFGVTPDPRFLYLSEQHREALASLFYGVKTCRGLMALVAPPGMGKTTLLFRLLQHLRRSARTVFLFQTQCDSSGLMRYLMGDLGIDTHGQDFVTMHEQLNELLIREANNGKSFVLVIDEAQNLDDSVLETARLLSDFETPSKKLLQIVFAGQPQLAEKLQRPELAQLRQRISILGRLEPFSVAEVRHYINHRLRVAGHNSDSLFTSAAFEGIAASSKGIPRNINMLCFNALSLGCALGRKQIDADLIRVAEADLDLSSLADERGRELLPAPLPVPASHRPSAAKVKICIGSEVTSSPSGVGTAPSEELVTWNGDTANANQTRHPSDARRTEVDTAVILKVESFERAQERKAEILAEKAVEDTSSDTCFVHFENRDAASRILGTAQQDAQLRLDDSYYVIGDRVSMPRGDVLETIAPDISLCASERDHTIGRLAAVASVFLLTLFVGIFYRQDLETAAAQTRVALTLAVASLSPKPLARKAELVEPAATEQRPKGASPEPSGRSTVVTKGVPATTTSAVATLAGASLTQVRERQAEVTITANFKHLRQYADGTTAVIVQPGDELRQICLGQLGSYNAGVFRKVRELNPELTDPDRIIVGQRIVLPPQATVRTNASRFSAVPKQ